MKSALRRLAAQSRTPVPLGQQANRGHIFNLGGGIADRESYLRTYGKSGTIFSIVSLLAQSTAGPAWHLYRKAPKDGRVRYTTGDRGSDQRTEVVQHPALYVLDSPNDFHTRFEFFEGSNQHLELSGETYWVIQNEPLGYPTAMWYVRPDRMEPVPSPDDFLVGWIYTGPNGEQIPLMLDEVIQERLPDPIDPYRGAGPVASILPNIEQQRYATEYQRNLFIAGADPGGIIQVPNKLTDTDFMELVDRWRETHQGVARAGRVGILEAGATWVGRTATNKDMEYVKLRTNNRDEIREAWRMNKSMLGTVEDVNRANAQTAQEVFSTWQVQLRLNRRRDTLNRKFLRLFGATGEGVEFDYEDPSPENREEANAELTAKAQAAAVLVQAGYDHADVLEAVGLPDMGVTIHDSPVPALPPRWTPAPDPSAVPAPPVPALPPAPAGAPNAWLNKRDTVAKVVEILSDDYPPESMAWVHHTTWMGPLDIKPTHIDLTGYDKLFGRSQADVDKFKKRIIKGKSKPVILVKTPNNPMLSIVDGHGRTAAYCQLGQPIRAYVGVTTEDHGDWETMHDHQDIAGAEVGTEALANMLADFVASPIQRAILNGIGGSE